MPLGRGDAVRVNPRCLLTELGDGTGVVLDLDTKFYFTLNRAGVVVWKALASRAEGATAEALAATLEEHFEITAEGALEDVLHVLAAMAGEALVERC